MLPSGALNLWNRLSPLQRAALAGLAALGVGLLLLFFSVARTPDLAPAFSGLKDEEAAAIVAKLKEKGVPYDASERGTIRVPAGQVQEIRLMLAGEGLPQQGSSIGFELFREPHLGMTEFAEKINYQRALEGELSRSIERLEAVQAARVHLVLPEPSLFLANQKEATGSVVVGLKPGRRLDPSQVQGIAQLVANSVEGLKPQAVNIIDSSGNVLNDRAGENDPARLTSSRAGVQRGLESRLETDVRSMLTQVLGSDKAIVRVTADLDWDQYEANSETFSPAERQPQIRSQRQVTENTQGGSTGGGVPGTDSNLPGYTSQAGGGNSSAAERRDTTTNYELSKLVEKTIRAPGAVKRLSVAVALDSESLTDAAQADALTKLVATAAGLDVNRGDVVTLTSLPFNGLPAKPTEAAEQARQIELVLSIARLLAMVLGPLLVALVIWLALRRGKQSPDAEGTISVLAGQQLAQALRQAGAPGLPSPKAEEAQRRHLEQELARMTNSDPQNMALLVRSLLHENRQESAS